MSAQSPEGWLLANDAYLAAAVAWLLRLFESGPDDKRTGAAFESMAKAAAIEPVPALVEVGDRFRLTPFEYHLLLLCVAIELHPELSRRCAQAQGDPARPFPTFSLAESLFDGATWAAISPERPLRRWRLIEVHQPGAQPLSSSALRADERVVAAAKGLRQLDNRITMLASPLDAPLPPGSPLPPSQTQVVKAVVRKVRALSAPTAGSQRPPPLQLVGTDAPSKQAVATAAAQALGLWPYRLSVDVLPAHAAEIETLARLWEREAILLPVALYVDARDTDPQPLLTRFLARTSGLVFLDTREARTDLGDGSTIFDVARPTPKEQEFAWGTALDPKLGDSPDNGLPSALVSRFNFDAGAIFRLAAKTRDAEELEAHCRRSARLRMQGLAYRIEPRVGLEQVILPPESGDLLAQIVRQARHRVKVYDDWGFRERMNRGLGISALFSGESGTGKTMAAEAIAQALRLDLYRIDLSAVVSKYIGETEKNLRRVFDAAEAGGAVLFFDEADALFGKRSEVKDSHDRYANIEISYLLQRMEEFDGLAILATNLKSAIDPAFMRRLRFVVDFPFPNTQDRRRIWQQAFPSRLTGDLSEEDWDRLARFQLTGGHIVNIALNAAFRAASEGMETVQMRHILLAARAEYGKLERPINEGDFR